MLTIVLWTFIASKDDAADFRSVLKHKEYEKRKSDVDAVDWGDLKAGPFKILINII